MFYILRLWLLLLLILMLFVSQVEPQASVREDDPPAVRLEPSGPEGHHSLPAAPHSAGIQLPHS